MSATDVAEYPWLPNNPRAVPSRRARGLESGGVMARPYLALVSEEPLTYASARGGVHCVQRHSADHPAALAVHVDGHVALHGDTVHEPVLVVVVVDRPVLGSAVIPDCDVTRCPVPSNSVLRHGDSSLQQLEKGL